MSRLATHVKPTWPNDTPFSEVIFLESPPCGLLLMVMLARSTSDGNFRASWGMMSGKVVVGSTWSRNWPSLLTNRRIIVPGTQGFG